MPYFKFTQKLYQTSSMDRTPLLLDLYYYLAVTDLLVYCWAEGGLMSAQHGNMQRLTTDGYLPYRICRSCLLSSNHSMQMVSYAGTRAIHCPPCVGWTPIIRVGHTMVVTSEAMVHSGCYITHIPIRLHSYGLIVTSAILFHVSAMIEYCGTPLVSHVRKGPRGSLNRGFHPAENSDGRIP